MGNTGNLRPGGPGRRKGSKNRMTKERTLLLRAERCFNSAEYLGAQRLATHPQGQGAAPGAVLPAEALREACGSRRRHRRGEEADTRGHRGRPGQAALCPCRAGQAGLARAAEEAPLPRRRWEPRSTSAGRCRPERRALSGALAPFISVGEQEHKAWRDAADIGPAGTSCPARCPSGALAAAGALGGCVSASASSCGRRTSTNGSSWRGWARRPGRRGTAHLVAPDSPPGGWPAAFEVRPHPIWRRGRVFFRCASCGRLATRMYLPPGGGGLRCRRCWGLSYESQKWSYHGDWWARLPNYTTTERQREERRAKSRLRYARRRRYLARGACAR